MRKIVLLMVLGFIVLSCAETYAQDAYKLKREITVRWGMIDDYNDNDFFFDWGGYGYASSPLERYNSGKYYHDNKVCTQAISLSYTHEIKRWLALSINASYSGVSQKERRAADNQVVNEYRKHRMAVFPMAKFTYLNRPVIRLYSAAGFGLGLIDEEWSNDDRSHKREMRLDGQMTFFGVSVGKDLFASWELGVGAMGYLTMAAGYRF